MKAGGGNPEASGPEGAGSSENPGLASSPWDESGAQAGGRPLPQAASCPFLFGPVAPGTPLPPPGSLCPVIVCAPVSPLHCDALQGGDRVPPAPGTKLGTGRHRLHPHRTDKAPVQPCLASRAGERKLSTASFPGGPSLGDSKPPGIPHCPSTPRFIRLAFLPYFLRKTNTAIA